MQPSPPSISRTFSSSHTETLYPFNNNSPFPPSSQPGHFLLIACSKFFSVFLPTINGTWKEPFGKGFFFFFNLFIFIFGCLGSLLLHAGFSLVAASRGYSSLRFAGFSLGGFSCCRARALGARASVVVAHGLSSCGSRALERRLSSCGAWA